MDPIQPLNPRDRDLERIYRAERLRDERRRDGDEEERRRRRRPPPDPAGDEEPPDDEGHTIDVRV
jgi:hypothetical protein